MRLQGRRIIFGNPPKADIVIFDEVNSQYVAKAISKGHKVTVFKVRPFDIYLSIAICFSLVKLILSDVKKDKGFEAESFVSSFGRKLKVLYLEACFHAVNPLAVVTMIDNDSYFHQLSQNCTRFPFIAIQNGSRLSYVAHETKGYYLQHLFSFGEHESRLYPELGYRVEHYYPVGSLIGSLYLEDKAREVKYDLLIVSIWRGDIGFAQEVQDTMKAMEIMDIHLAKYIRDRNIKAAVILRNEREGLHWFMPPLNCNEEEYFRRIYGDSVEIIETDFKVRNIYQLMQESKLSVSCLSSALLEIFGKGGKILYCNFLGLHQYHQDIDSSIVCINDDFQMFSKQLDELIEMPTEVYNEKFAELQKYYMNFPENKPTYTAIAEKIDMIIDNQSKSYGYKN
jgi:hypothetical protein